MYLGTLEATLIFIFPLPQVSFFFSFFLSCPLSTSPITSCMYIVMNDFNFILS